MASPVSKLLTVDRKAPLRDRPEDLVAACRRNERWAWDAIVERFGRLVYSIPRRYGMHDADADDVFQSVFVILYERIESLRQPERLSSWLITTAHRECWRIGRRSGRSQGFEEHLPDVSSPSDDDVDRWEQQDIVRHALDRLGGKCEPLLTMLFIEGSNYETIATTLGMKIGSIGPTRARCFSKLESILREYGLEPDLEGDEAAPVDRSSRTSSRVHQQSTPTSGPPENAVESD